jgi:hypothetical protein
MKRIELLFTVSITMSLTAPSALADGEVSAVLGGLVGGNITLSDDLSTDTSFDNAVLYGVRGGWFGNRFGVEGSFTRSPTGLKGQAFDGLLEAETPTTYIEGNVVLLFLTGNVSPFVTGGAGLHRIKFEVNDILGLADIDKLGYNFGGGVKANFDAVTIRFDIRDHLTTLRTEDFGILGEIAESTGVDLNQNLHNVELSVSVGVRF